MPYQTLNAAIANINPALCAAEAHGVAVGMLCARADTQAADWLAETIGHSPLPAGLAQTLQQLFEQTRGLLDSGDFGLALLLPDDEADLAQRALALRDWSQGLLYGIGISAQGLAQTPQTREILADIGQFTRIDQPTTTEEDEQAYMEITEYLRIAVHALRGGFNPATGAPHAAE